MSDSVISPDIFHFGGHIFTDVLPHNLHGRFPINNSMYSSMLLLGCAQLAWSDSDDTLQFLRYFYSNWLSGLSAREALRDAQREAIKDGLHPVVWAAWVLI